MFYFSKILRILFEKVDVQKPPLYFFVLLKSSNIVLRLHEDWLHFDKAFFNKAQKHSKSMSKNDYMIKISKFHLYLFYQLLFLKSIYCSFKTFLLSYILIYWYYCICELYFGILSYISFSSKKLSYKISFFWHQTVDTSTLWMYYTTFLKYYILYFCEPSFFSLILSNCWQFSIVQIPRVLPAYGKR